MKKITSLIALAIMLTFSTSCGLSDLEYSSDDISSETDTIISDTNSDNGDFSSTELDNTSSETSTETEPSKVFTTDFQIECAENWFFDKYNVIIEIDGNQIDILDHGASEYYTLELSEGSHTIAFKSNDDSSVYGTETFEVTKSDSFGYKIQCNSLDVGVDHIEKINPPISYNDISNKSYSEVERLFKDAGFITIQTVEITDLLGSEADQANIVSGVSIGNNQTFSSSDSFLPSSPVTINYRTVKNINPPYDTKTTGNTSYNEIVEAFENAGFIDVTTKPLETYKSNGNVDNSVAYIYIDNLTCNCKDEYNPTLPVEIVYYVNIEDPVVTTTTATTTTVTTTTTKPSTNDTPSYTNSGNGGGGNSVTVPSQSESVGNLVWVPTNGGTKYHSRKGCSNMENPIQVSIETAKANGYTACKRCH